MDLSPLFVLIVIGFLYHSRACGFQNSGKRQRAASLWASNLSRQGREIIETMLKANWHTHSLKRLGKQGTYVR